MAVKVKTTRKNNGGRIVDEHQTGTSIDVQDAHLFVYSSQRTLAIYSPGDWLNAEVDAEVDA